MDDPSLKILLPVIVLFMLLSFIAVRLWISRKTGHRVAERSVMDGSRWSLGFTAEEGRRYNLCLEYRIKHIGSEDDYGLVVDYSCQCGGETFISERAGAGRNVPPARDRQITSYYNCSHTSILGDSTSRATIILCTIGPLNAYAEAKATGEVITADGTTLMEGTVFFARQA